MTKKLEERLDAVYQSGGKRDELDHAYDEWAESYDRDLWASGNPFLTLIIALAARHIPGRNDRILDGGCGTGNAGALLHFLGYKNIIGVDASDGMLAAAEAKGCYQELHRKLLGKKIDLPPESFDAITAAGVLTHGHAPPESLDGLLEVAKPAAPIVFSISKPAYEESGFGDKIAELERAGAWTLVERTEPFKAYPFSEQYADLRHWICVYRKAY